MGTRAHAPNLDYIPIIIAELMPMADLSGDEDEEYACILFVLGLPHITDFCSFNFHCRLIYLF